MEFKDENLYIDLAKRTGISILLGYLGFYFLGLVLIAYPAIFMVTSIDKGIKYSGISMFLSSLVIGLGTNLLTGLALFFTYFPMILVFHYAVNSRKGFWFTIISMALVLLVSTLALQLGTTPLESIDLNAIIEESISLGFGTMEEGLSNLELRRIEDLYRQGVELGFSLIPGIIIAMISIVVYFNLMITGRFLLKNNILISQPPLFPNFVIPKITFIVMGILFGGSLILQQIGYEYHYIITRNLVLVFCFIYFINGLATISNLFYRYRVPIFFRYLFYGLMFALYQLTIAVVVVGLLDSLFGRRGARVLK